MFNKFQQLLKCGKVGRHTGGVGNKKLSVQQGRTDVWEGHQTVTGSPMLNPAGFILPGKA